MSQINRTSFLSETLLPKIAGWVLLGLLSAYLFFSDFPFGTDVDRPFWERLLDAGHFPFFAVVVLGVTYWAKSITAYLILAELVFFSALIVAVEYVQPYFNRSCSWTDAVNGFAGVVSGMLLACLLGNRYPRRWLYGWVAINVVALALVLMPAHREFKAITWRAKSLPLIADFEEDVELMLWHPADGGPASGTIAELSTGQAISGNRSLRLLNIMEDSIAVTYDAGNQNWDGHRLLRGYVYSGRAISLYMRIDDSEPCVEFNDRFNRKFALSPGWNEIQISTEELARGPSARLLELSRIRRMILFTIEDPVSELYLDRFELVD